jgi:adenylate cyclase
MSDHDSCSAARRMATVLFIDVEGSLGLSHAVAPEEWWTTMDELFELMCEGVYRYGGWVGAFTGDGIHAIFEASRTRSPHAARACAAAVWLRDAIADLAARVSRDRGFDVAVRLGLHAGPILVGTIGDRYNRYYTACGYSVGLAKRMETLARPGRIYMTAATAALATRNAQVRAVGPRTVKGALHPVDVVELTDWRGASPPRCAIAEGLAGAI